MTKEIPDQRRAQTLDRGLQVLEYVAGARGGASVSELAEVIGVHRTVASRLLVTLAARGYVERQPNRLFTIGARLVELSRGFHVDLRTIAEPEMLALAELVGATAVLTVQSGDEAVVVQVTEPPGDAARLTFKLGSRHPMNRGAEGMAMLAGRPPTAGERDDIQVARDRGYSVSTGEVASGTWGLAAPIRPADEPARASIGVVSLHPLSEESVAEAVRGAAERISSALGAPVSRP